MGRRWVGNLLLMFAGGLIGLLILEGGLRLAGISYPYYYIADPIVGYAHKPNAEGWWKKEGLTYIRINSAGFRDREHKKEKSPGTFRIAILGDSYSEALQVPVGQTYWALLEQDLQRCRSLAGRQIEVLNFGVSGYGTAQELLMLRHKGWEYSPDLVILAFLTGNDIRNNSRALQNDSTRPYFIERDGRLILDASFRDSLAFYVRNLEFSQKVFEHVRVLQVLREAEYKIQAYIADLNHRNKVSGAVGSVIGLDQMEYLEPQERLWTEAWEVTEKLIAQMRDEVREKGAEFLLVILSNPDQVHPDPRHRQELAAKLGVQDLLYPDRRIVSWAERHDTAVLSLVQPSATYAEERQVFLHGFSNATIGDGHWNAEGHRVAGDLIAQRVCSMPHLR
jgi:lysophospholipase L1-like esterase